jgi:Rrf2 family protein
MQITRKTDYALRIMRTIGENTVATGGVPISVRKISELDNVPYQFARRITYDLANAGLIKVTRGARGGAVLADEPDKILMRDIVEVGQGAPMCSRCKMGDDWCENEGTCNIKHTLEALDEVVDDYLTRVTLVDLMREEKMKP